MSILNEDFELSNGIKIPKLAFGTWQIPDNAVKEPVLTALRNGYRHIDTALAYGNEKGVGKAVRDSGIARKSIFITTKIPAEVKSYAEAVKKINESLNNLDLGYIDLLLIHAPKPWSEMGGGTDRDYFEENAAVWKAMEESYKKGLIRSIGVSNFDEADIKNIFEKCEITPMANQIRYFIGYTQEAITSFCKKNNILVEAYSPIATGALLGNENIGKIAQKYNKTIPQICIRYILQKNILPIPKSTHDEYIIQNTMVDFEISQEDMEYLNG